MDNVFFMRGNASELLVAIQAHAFWRSGDTRRSLTGLVLHALEAGVAPDTTVTVSASLSRDVIRRVVVYTDTPDETGMPTVILRI